MIKINKNQLPGMREDGQVKTTSQYTIAEYEPRGLRLEDLAQRIASQIDAHFILYDYKGNIYTDNEDVIQILKDQYPSGDYSAYGTPDDGFVHDNMIIDWDTILKLNNEKYEFTNYFYIPKWYYIYKKLANLLNQIDTIFDEEPRGIQLYNKCIKDNNFRQNNEWIEKFNNEWKVKSLDPIHIFASINNNKLSKEKKLKRINILFKILDEYFREEYKDIDFNGCPSPNITKIISARNKDSQEEIWKVFEDVMQNSQDANINFKDIKNWYGIDIKSFTIFLFWIDAKNFLPLDKNTTSLLENSKKDFIFPETYKNYKNLLIIKNTNLYILLALIAYDRKKEQLLNDDNKKKIKTYLNENITSLDTDRQILKSNNFKIISIKLLNNCNLKYLKTLKEDENYIFDKSYRVSNNKVEKISDISLYDFDNLKININAIVGKNGTGKSTLVELLFAFIYNLAIEKGLLLDAKRIDNINLELIYESYFIYKIKYENNKFSFFRYKQDNFIEEDSNFNIKKFFYTIGINYSQHSLNQNTIGNWIEKLFHKNDAYQTPVVIEPYRKNGNIDINIQEKLVKQRLLANLLLQEDKDDIENSFRQLTEFYKAVKLKITFDEKNFKERYKNFLNLIDINQINSVYDVFDINDTQHPLKNFIEQYILIKLIKISRTYTVYKDYFKEEKFNNFTQYLEKIKEDDSHITYKLKQAINFLKYIELHISNGDEIDIEDLSNRIEDIKRRNNDEVINRYLPPSIFDIDILLENDINFSTLSSGEKQKIYSVNSILYHINNINSVENNDLLQYKYINIVLDEIELYFHPELQRVYLNYLHHSLSKVNTNNILGINITFVTHSPFILSDIPDNKILFLDKNSEDIYSKTISSTKTFKTFGANIHELLINGFFMKNSIGEFALNEIKKIIDFHNKVLQSNDKNLEKLKKEYSSLKERFYFIQEHIGEEYIAEVLKNHIGDIEKKLHSDEYKQKKIEELKKELEALQKRD